jgi:hypothetical protein
MVRVRVLRFQKIYLNMISGQTAYRMMGQMEDDVSFKPGQLSFIQQWTRRRMRWVQIFQNPGVIAVPAPVLIAVYFLAVLIHCPTLTLMRWWP